jgi:hypothetical protein
MYITVFSFISLQLNSCTGTLIRRGVRVVKLRLVAPSPSSDDTAAAISPEEVHVIRLMAHAMYEMYVPKSERRWRTALTSLAEVPCTLRELSDAGAVDGDVGLLQVCISLLVTRLDLSLQLISCTGGAGHHRAQRCQRHAHSSGRCGYPWGTRRVSYMRRW